MVYENMSPEELYELWQSDDEEAFEELYKRFFPQLYTFIKNRFHGFSKDDITDIIQDVFVKLFNTSAKFDPSIKCQFFTWLRLVCLNICLDRCRKRGYHSPDFSLSQDKILFLLNTQESIHFIQQTDFYNFYKLNAEEILLKDEKLKAIRFAISKANLTLEEQITVDLFLLLHKKPKANEISSALQEITNREYSENTLRNRWKTAIDKISKILKNDPLFADLFLEDKEDKEDNQNRFDYFSKSKQVPVNKDPANEIKT